MIKSELKVFYLSESKGNSRIFGQVGDEITGFTVKKIVRSPWQEKLKFCLAKKNSGNNLERLKIFKLERKIEYLIVVYQKETIK